MFEILYVLRALVKAQIRTDWATLNDDLKWSLDRVRATYQSDFARFGFYMRPDRAGDYYVAVAYPRTTEEFEYTYGVELSCM